jgi:hypothetical protein
VAAAHGHELVVDLSGHGRSDGVRHENDQGALGQQGARHGESLAEVRLGEVGLGTQKDLADAAHGRGAGGRRKHVVNLRGEGHHADVIVGAGHHPRQHSGRLKRDLETFPQAPATGHQAARVDENHDVLLPFRLAVAEGQPRAAE